MPITFITGYYGDRIYYKQQEYSSFVNDITFEGFPQKGDIELWGK